MAIRSIRDRLLEPCDGASLAAFRALFGAMMALSVVRFWALGWIDELYVAPSYHFTYWGFSFVRPLPAPFIHAVFAVMGLAAIGVAVARGIAYRVSVATFLIAFTYVELLDRATYLNHYYFVSLVALLLLVLPADKTVPRYAIYALRAQVGVVYAFAGLAKLNADWLLRAEPLRTWLQVHTDLPIVGPLMDDAWVAHAASIAGCVFDLAVVPALLHRRTRPFAYFALVVFHLATGALFHIGVFPLVMIVCSTVFFEPDWPRRAQTSLGPPLPQGAARGMGAQWPLAFLAAHFAIQLALPLRQHFYDGDPRWTEQGFRFAWNVMLMEKTGVLELRVRDPHDGREWNVSPRDELTLLQVKMVATQPDMILQYAHHLEDRFARCEGPGGACSHDVEVRADAYVSLNGRPSARLVDPTIDLTREHDGFAPYRFVTAGP